MRMNGYFIVFEGGDGSGKSTQAHLLYSRLRKERYPCILTEEPGATETGKVLRELILHPRSVMDSKAELFLFLADRADHVASVIAPALSENRIVICSRYLFSTLVYQGFAREAASFDFLLQMNLFAVGNLLPDTVVYLDTDPARGLSKAKHTTRQHMRYSDGDRIEREGLDFQKRVRKGYLWVARRFQDSFVVVETAGKSKHQIGRLVYDQVKRRLIRSWNGHAKGALS